MKSRRSWLLGLALGAALSFAAPSAQAGGGPRIFTYQGLVVDQANHPLTGTHTVVVQIWDAGGTSGGTILYSEQHQSILFNQGVFDLFVGSGNSPVKELPVDLSFGAPYWIEIIVDPGLGSEIRFPRQQLFSAPYALNAERVNGMMVSPSPVQGDTTIFPIPIDASGKIDKSILPTPALSVQTINTVAPDNNGAISLTGNGITITPNLANHTIELSAAGASSDTIYAGPGIEVTPSIIPNTDGSGRHTTISIANGAITNNMFSPGAISGSKISQIAGLGLVQDQAGFLNVNTDNQTLTIQNNQVMIRPDGVGTLQIANGAVNLAAPNQKVNGILPVGNGGTGLSALATGSILVGSGANPMSTLAPGAAGTVLMSNGASVAPSYTLLLADNTTLLGNGTSTSPFKINLGNANTWTVAQTFPSINLTNASNQITFGATGATSILSVAPAAGRTVTIPDGGVNSSVILNNSTGGQSVTTSSPLASALTVTTSNPIAAALTVNSSGSTATNPALSITGTETHTGATTQLGAFNLAGATSPIQLGSVAGTQGQIIASNGTTATPVWVGPGSTTTVLHGNAAGVPTYGAVSLTTDVSNTLPVGNGGTGIANPTAGALLVGNGASAMTQLADVATGSVLVSGGIGASPAWGNGAGMFILNQTTQQNPASFNISGSGTVAGTLSAGSLTVSGTSTFSGLTPNSNVRTGVGGILTTGAINLNGGATEVINTLPVGNGGTGAATFLAGVVHANGTSPFTTSQVNLGTEVTGTLPATNGGTGSNVAPTSAQIPVGTGSGAYAPASISGDAALASNGALTLQNTAAARTDIGLGTGNTPTFAGLTLTAPLTVPNGGTGASTFTSNGVLLGNTTGAISATSAGTANQVLRVPGGGGAPAFGAIDLTPASGAVSGTLGVANGGTGANTFATAGVIHTASGTAALTSSLIMDADVASNAAIAGTKINPNFGSQAVSTTGTLNAGATTINGNLIQVIGGQQGIQTHLNTAARTYTWPDKSGTVAMLSDLATNVGASAAADRMLRGNGLGGWVDAGPNALLGATGSLSVLGGSGITVTGGGNITTSTGAVVTGNNALAGRVQFGDGSTNNTGTITVTQPYTSNQSYNLPNYSGTVILDNSTNGQTITNANPANASLAINSNTSSPTNPALLVKGTSSFGGGITMTTGALNLTSGGITNTGSITGATSITASANISGASLTATTSGINLTGAFTMNNASAAGASGQLLISGGAATTPSWTNVSAVAVTTAQGTTDQVFVNGDLLPHSGAVTISLPQSIATTSSPTFSSLTLTNPLTVGNGGTGTSTAPTSGQILVGNAGGTAYAPVSMSNDVTISNTGAATIANNAVTTAKILNANVTYQKLQNESASTLLGNPTGALASPSEITLGTGVGFSGTTLTNTGVTSITGTANQVIASAATGAVTLSLPQSIATTSSPTFSSLTLTNPLTVGNGGTGTSTAPTSGQILVGNAGGTAYAPVSMSNDVTISNTGAATIANNAVTTAKILNANVTYQKLQNESASTLLGNPTGALASPSEITLGTGVGFSGTTLTNTGVTSITGTANQVIASAATGAVTLSLPQSIATTSSPTFSSLTLTNPLTVPNGGTGLNALANGALAFGSGGNTMNTLGIGTAGQVLVVNGGGTAPTWASGSGTFILNQTAAPQTADFWIGGTGQIENTTATPALRLQNSGGNALTVTSGATDLKNTTVTGTLTSTGNSTLGTSSTATANSFGTTGDAAAAANTIGSAFNGSLTTINGRALMSGSNQTTANELTIQNLPNAALSWGIRVIGSSSTVTSNATQGIFASAAAAAGQNAVAGRFDATSGAVVTGLSVTANSGTTSNTGLSISVNDASRVGAIIHANAGGTGVVVDNASIGFAVPGNTGTLPSTATAFSAKLSATGSQTGLGVDLATGVSGDAGVSIVNTGAANGVSIGGVNAGGTGLSITTTGGSGETISGVGTGTGLGISGISSGTGLSVSAPTTGVAIKTQGAGAGTVALQVDNGPVRATGTNQFAGVVPFTSNGSGVYTITNPYAVTGATIIVTLSDVSDANIPSWYVSNIGSGQFTVHANPANGVTGNIHYIIINH